MDAPIVLGFDTSGPWVGTALFQDGDVRAADYTDMARGQAERLLPAIEETLAEAGVTLQDLDCIGVGVGPGNFTGIRISVAAARGLALGLGIPAIGVSLLDALAFDAPRPALTTLNAPRDRLYIQRHGAGAERGPAVIARGDLSGWVLPGITLVGQDSPDLSAEYGIPHAPAAFAPASAIARIAARRFGDPQPRPAPLYLRPADAAPPSDAPPVILP
ncbi:tRNA (adenosine(37)-N6)-threonylcarbamoyltransferase complex dimerization subunit type 1 TsaB [Jannaschia sp. S6380]|uniref:tRNA (adenosine(37)-N6)-threonylcarbamoyltransferase complex dimerization subunit type 1 TsaB n=1 Tax=Jannaschia sp. S6380 TaxID=2926408 RepID=UPI001FF528D8|nr:tRNA (adenosine(37)-N6)-threonylcarbamoyltransferase complex dimerization subunit type 1 TsaB [Jannaschia sp. S6380]MCK0168118.1 tRNA (adenosine(37)-N6)-threonylcarbamoyltransferase complex dimerization subunit type 1 TsaB [Jannaschia sp. S6380]